MILKDDLMRLLMESEVKPILKKKQKQKQTEKSGTRFAISFKTVEIQGHYWRPEQAIAFLVDVAYVKWWIYKDMPPRFWFFPLKNMPIFFSKSGPVSLCLVPNLIFNRLTNNIPNIL